MVGQSAHIDELLDGIFVLSKFADGQQGAINCYGGNNSIDARTIWQAGIYGGVLRINAATQRQNDPVDDPEDLIIISKADVGF
ncbi:hypothetical protein SDC9_155999 [bioreactor metagenome]|uniref:Uncharacterized protein n=1 Tax=bioreactor metagenome TaxID=1076179 RepID=A0A645F7Z0_9ZZZZ